MPRGPRPSAQPTINDEDRCVLENLTRRRKTNSGLANRARIVLLAAEGVPDLTISKRIGCSRGTVARWRKRYCQDGLNGLYDEPRPGRPPVHSDNKIAEIITLTLEEMPRDATHWSTRSMAEKVGVSAKTVERTWRANGLQPHRTAYWKLSTDPLFVEKVRDIVGLYLDPPTNAVVLCVDEKSQIQALDRTQPMIPMCQYQVEKRTHDYARHGTTSLFAALNVATGEVLSQCHKRHRTEEFRKFLNHINRETPDDLDVHVVMDNYCTHKSAPIERWFKRHPRFHVHYTPTYSSWINQVERFFALLTGKMLKRGVHKSVKELVEAIETFIQCHNENPRPFSWVKDADAILESVARFCGHVRRVHSMPNCSGTSGAGH